MMLRHALPSQYLGYDRWLQLGSEYLAHNADMGWINACYLHKIDHATFEFETGSFSHGCNGDRINHTTHYYKRLECYKELDPTSISEQEPESEELETAIGQ